MKKNVAIVGAGWAGLACAIRLCDAGHAVTVFEAAPMLGGRARYAMWQREDGVSLRLDNGQHILLGAYTQTLKLLQHIGVDATQVFRRLPFTLHTLGRTSNDAPHLHLRLFNAPEPLHLALGLCAARGLSWHDKILASRLLLRCKAQQWTLPDDCSVTQLCATHRQSLALNQKLWNPLCVAALNTAPDIASAQVFLNVLRDSVGGGRRASDVLLPTADLTTLFPQAAEKYLQQRGARVVPRTAIQQISSDSPSYRLHHAQGSEIFDAVVLATAPHQVTPLLQELSFSASALLPLLHQLTQFHYQPITTAYLHYAQPVSLPYPMCALHENPAQQAYGQWVFDRAALMQDVQASPHPGLLAVVISTTGAHLDLDHDTLAQALDRQLRQHIDALPALQHSKIINEKRATYACTVGLKKPHAMTGLPGLYLAGDYLDAAYPATLEAAVRSAEMIEIAESRRSGERSVTRQM